MGWTELRGMEAIANSIHDLADALRGFSNPGEEHRCKRCDYFDESRDYGGKPCDYFRDVQVDECKDKSIRESSLTCKECDYNGSCRQFGDTVCKNFRLRRDLI